MLQSAAYACAFLFSVTGFVSIAASHLFLGLAIVLLLASRTPVRFPPLLAPIGLFFAWTLVSAFAADDLAGAFPQIKKFYVYLALPVAYSIFRSVDAARRLFEAWIVVGVIAVSFAIAQFVAKIGEAQSSGKTFLEYYTPDRITGFFSHWMTFSQAALLILAVLSAYLLFGRRVRYGRGFWIAAGVLLAAGLVLSFTRSVWLAMILLGLYFVWERKPKLLWLVPIAAALLVAAAPGPLRERIDSIRNPGPREARPIMWRTGLNMIRATVDGVGPMHVGKRFHEFQPADVTELPPAYYEHLHNVYIHYAAERGLPAAFAILWMLGKILWDMRRGIARMAPGRSEARFLAEAAFAGTLAVMAVSCFDVTLGDSEVLGAFLTLTALGYSGVAPEPEPARAAA
ncbi:MAG: O-antigen ligase family protein [Bryobacterales bacterium]